MLGLLEALGVFLIFVLVGALTRTLRAAASRPPGPGPGPKVDVRPAVAWVQDPNRSRASSPNATLAPLHEPAAKQTLSVTHIFSGREGILAAIVANEVFAPPLALREPGQMR